MDPKMSSRPLNSTLIYVENEQSRKTLEYLVEVSKNESTKEIYRTIINLSTIANDNYVSFNEVVESVDVGKISVRYRFKELKEHSLVNVASGRSVFGDAASNRLEVLSVVPIGKADFTKFQKGTKKLVNGRKSSKVIAKRLSETNTPIPEGYRDNTIHNAYQFPIPNEFSNVIAPGNTIVTRKEYLSPATDGSKKLNFAQGVYGIINDNDKLTLNVLYQLTISYIQTLPNHIRDNIDTSMKVPIWVEDIMKLRGFKDTTESREEVSHSVLRIHETLYKIYAGNVKLDELDESHDSNVLFRFLSGMQVLSKNGDGPSDNASDFDAKNSDVSSMLKRDWGSDFPFSCISITWNPDFYKRLFFGKFVFSSNILVNQLTGTIYNLYSTIRLDYFSNNKVLFKDRKEVTLSLFELAYFVWPNEESDVIREIAKSIIIELKSLHRNKTEFLDYISIRDGDDCSIIDANLFGIKLEMHIPRLDSPRLANNLKSPVHITVHEQELIESAGGSYKRNGSNKPLIASPLEGLLDLTEQGQLKINRRVLPKSAKLLQSKFKNIKHGKYVTQFEVGGQKILFSLYNDNEERQDIIRLVSLLSKVDQSVVELLLSTYSRKLSMMDNFTYERIKDISEKIKAPVNELVLYFQPRLKYTDRILGDNMKELKDYFK